MIQLMSLEESNALLLNDAYNLLVKAKGMVSEGISYYKEADKTIAKAEEKLKKVQDNWVQMGFVFPEME